MWWHGTAAFGPPSATSTRCQVKKVSNQHQAPVLEIASLSIALGFIHLVIIRIGVGHYPAFDDDRAAPPPA